MRCTEHEKWLICMLCVFAFLAVAMLLDRGKSDTVKVSDEHMCFDTTLNITLYVKKDEEKNAKKIIKKCFDKVDALEHVFSATNDASELSMMNATAYKNRFKASDELYNIIMLAKEYDMKTNHAFDISLGRLSDLWDIKGGRTTLPSNKEIKAVLEKTGMYNIECSMGYVLYHEDIKVDLGAIAKGYTTDCLKTLLLEEGIKEAVVNFGGNVLVIGDKDGDGYNIGIKDPRGDGVKTSLKVKDACVVTSGDYERYVMIDGKRYHHIMDNTTGYPSDNLVTSVTVVGENGAICDILSTALFVIGKDEGLKYIKNFEGYEVLYIIDDGGMFESEGFSKYR